MPTELRYIERSVFIKEENIQNLWNFELGSQESIFVPLWIIIEFQQRNRQDSQNLNNDSLRRLPVISAQCFIGTEKSPDGGILVNYNDDDYSQGCTQIEETFRALSKDNILQPYTSDDDFKFSNARVVVIIGCNYNLYAFDIRYQQNFTAS